MDHVRIDEGVKRGPQRIRRLPNRRNEDGQVEAIPPDLDPDGVLQLYLASHTTSHIAKELGVRRSSLVAWLREQRPEQWRQVQQVRAFLTKEDGQEAVEDAADPFGLARARELLRAGQWDLERLDKDYAPQQHITVELTGDLGDRLRRARERVIEGEVVAQIPNQADAAVRLAADDNGSQDGTA